MSLKPKTLDSVPEETARVARAIFPKGNIYMRLYDTFGTFFRGHEFADLFPNDGQPALCPVRLALVLILQFAEGLTDRQAADAVRTRIDWKYISCLDLSDPGFHRTVLCEFRTRLIRGSAEERLLDPLLVHFQAHGLIRSRGQQRTDSTHVLGAIRAVTRLECVGEAIRYALNSVASATPEWLYAHSRPEWVDRYEMRMDGYRFPSSSMERTRHAEQMGADGLALLDAIYDPQTPAWMAEVPAIQILQKIWIQNYSWSESRHLCWRSVKEIPPSHLFISSPYDPEARYSQKRSSSWVGYKVHITQTCDEKMPRLVTLVETTAAPVADGDMTTPIHEALKAKDLLPAVHITDTGYLSP